jgi:hypothetical protein
MGCAWNFSDWRQICKRVNMIVNNEFPNGIKFEGTEVGFSFQEVITRPRRVTQRSQVKELKIRRE